MLKNQSDKDNKPVGVSYHYVKTGLIFVICFELLMLFMYGFFTSYTTVSYVGRLQYILTNTLAVLGFGLLLVYFKYSIKQTLIVALIVCGVNIQMGPLMQQFWYNVFIAGFNKQFTVSADNKFLLLNDTAVQDVKNITLGFVRISTYSSISLLVALSSVIGRIGVFNTLLTSILFNVGFNLNYYLNYLIYYKAGISASTFYIMDDYQGSRVFMFGAGFGLALLILYNKFNPVLRQENAQYTDALASFLTLLGTGFVISLFYFVLDTYTSQSKSLALLNIYFAFSGSIVSSIAISCIIAGVVTFHNVNMSIISGVIQISIIGGFIKTPYVSLLVGAFAGILTSLLSHFIHQKINNTKFTDAKGIFVIYFINSFLCAYFVCPIIIKAYKNVDSTIQQNEGYHMIYTSISLGIGFFSGLIAGIFRACFKEEVGLKDIQFFNKPFLLHRQSPPQKPISTKATVPPSVLINEAPSQQQLNAFNNSRIQRQSGLTIAL